ncbi:MAG TPA: IclR family transcriptional regulator [Ktedonobacterales bacterium]|nr:IclR family transcriptional regulator [Ktedonobacterales bacterium]
MDHINDANKGLEYRVHAVDKALDIVERVASHPTGIGVAALCKETGIPKSTVYSTIATLVDRGFLYRNDDGTIVLGPQFIALGAIARTNLGIVSVAQPIMQQLSLRVQLAVHLAIRDGYTAMYVHKVESPAPLRVSSDVGQRVSLFRSSVGRALLAFDQSADSLLAEVESAEGAPVGVDDLAHLRDSVALTRHDRVAYDDGEQFTGVRCLAAPVFDHGDQAVAALAISGLIHQLPDTHIAELRVALIDASEAISHRLGQRMRSSATTQQ